MLYPSKKSSSNFKIQLCGNLFGCMGREGGLYPLYFYIKVKVSGVKNGRFLCFIIKINITI